MNLYIANKNKSKNIFLIKMLNRLKFSYQLESEGCSLSMVGTNNETANTLLQERNLIRSP